MKVRYNLVVGVVLLVLGAVCVFLGLWLAVLGEFNPAVIAGMVPMLIGILYLVRPYFWVNPTSVAIPALIGPIRREFPFQTLEVNGGKLVAVRDDGTRKKVPVARWLAHSGDWAVATTPGIADGGAQR
ncbi:hypothetical protein [Actinocrispum wychmicini]|uniref:PH (Pleckstrin Homology) domain-containing protein n=1 Tax=Actinocrispum wychmicini TaxID=1213861 RepID=A0A4R2JYK2_9PSEU|nr:hypothetical protein [Actinocrispum wychmicini]TCO64974.1 hypothetical protein EV192_101758 [Actinocrispum wychmicini]